MRPSRASFLKSGRAVSAAVVAALASWAAASSGTAHAANNHPVIFVNGLGGFDRAEALGFKYWGGRNDLQAQLRSAYSGAQPVHMLTVGGFTSNWDRAVELYHQIKGGCVDYGAAHSSAAGHARTGRCYTGVYPAWSATQPVHLVGHGMGGQTARTLVQLLAANGAPRNSGLFGATAVSAAWIKSVTTIAAPNDGTTLPDVIRDTVPYVQAFVARLAREAGGRNDLADMVYDFRLDHWSIAPRAAGESFGVYFDRVLRSAWWYNTSADRAQYDLSPRGAAELNAWVTTLPGVYYYSWGASASLRSAVNGYHYPRGDTNHMLSQFCGPDYMGSGTRNQAGHPVIDSTWWESDCLVATRSQRAPTLKLSGGSVIATGAPINDISTGGSARAGQWNWRGMKTGVDHLDLIGWIPNPAFDALGFYRAHLDQLRSLP
jgi:triacylglycerol lipase